MYKTVDIDVEFDLDDVLEAIDEMDDDDIHVVQKHCLKKLGDGIGSISRV